MLKGSAKGVVSENVRGLKNSGMSERDAILKSMKETQKDLGPEPALAHKENKTDSYPYGLRLDLNHETMGKLGLKGLKGGQKVQLHAKGHVHDVSESSSSDGKVRRSASVQITHLAVAPKGGSMPVAADADADDSGTQDAS